MLDVEAQDLGYICRVFVFDDDDQLPNMTGLFQVHGIGDSYQVDIPLLPVADGMILTPADMSLRYPDVILASHVATEIRVDDDVIDIAWKSEVSEGTARLSKSRADKPSELTPEPEIRDWSSFKSFVALQRPRQFIYRGQNIDARMRTSFHRTHRKDLVRYVEHDINALRQATTGLTRHFFRTEDRFENAAFWNLLQHHGYPTPLLDWSHSPFVAAYFAFRSFRRTPEHGENVRIFVFDAAAWNAESKQQPSVIYVPPHITVIESLAIENPRATPQQALSTVTNLDDIESYIIEAQQGRWDPFLRAIDLPFSQRHLVLGELSMMGITAASLFPGLDGMCEAMKERYFGYNT